MKILISHDVDHLYSKDHWFRDFIYPKLWIRETLNLLKRKITLKEWFLRCTDCFRKERNHIEELMEFDSKHNVPSVFFFGMAKGLGMSYKPDEAKSKISYVKEGKFFVGVHGINFSSQDLIQNEFNTFRNLMGFEPQGIRMHYVRFDENTFSLLNNVGYLYDSTEFNKAQNGTIKEPYKVGNMWEFPLTMMDGYLPQNFEKAKEETLKVLEVCKEKKLNYISILFHDYQFSEAYKDIFEWYKWLIEYIENQEGLEFCSHIDAIKELEAKNV